MCSYTFNCFLLFVLYERLQDAALFDDLLYLNCLMYASKAQCDTFCYITYISVDHMYVPMFTSAIKCTCVLLLKPTRILLLKHISFYLLEHSVQM